MARSYRLAVTPPDLAPVIFYRKWCKMSTYEIVIACMKYIGRRYVRLRAA